MSIAKSVGALVRYFDKMRASERWVDMKKEMHQALEAIPVVGTPLAQWVPRVKEALQHYMNPGLIFEELGFRYFGPIDGHAPNLPGWRQIVGSEGSSEARSESLPRPTTLRMMVEVRGFEPLAACLGSRCATTALHPDGVRAWIRYSGALGR